MTAPTPFDHCAGQFSPQQWLRYSRQLQLGNFGARGQQRLSAARVVIIGAGGLGCPAALYLAAAGVGNISIVDGDKVELTNLQRQIAYTTDSVGKPKAAMLAARLSELNPEINVSPIAKHLTEDNAEQLIKNADLVLDCSDNFATRYLINDRCYQWQKPWLMASVSQFSGQCALFIPGNACFRCLFPQPPENAMDCNSAGVIGVVPGFLALYQASEAIKYLVGLDTPLSNQLLVIDALTVTQQKYKLQKNPTCKLCSSQPSGSAELKPFYRMTCVSDGTSDSGISVARIEETGIDETENEAMTFSANQFNRLRWQTNYAVLDVRNRHERESFNLGGQHIPLDELNQRLTELNPTRHYLVYCQSGHRSNKAVELLRLNGLKKSQSLARGIAGWLKDADS